MYLGVLLQYQLNQSYYVSVDLGPLEQSPVRMCVHERTSLISRVDRKREWECATIGEDRADTQQVTLVTSPLHRAIEMVSRVASILMMSENEIYQYTLLEERYCHRKQPPRHSYCRWGLDAEIERRRRRRRFWVAFGAETYHLKKTLKVDLHCW